ncbi:histidine triad nucleotide-binding protein [Leptospira wolffii]|uniref:Histidine triad nucleotide-binding protein n=1 Tax=Leptospira wolffii TaxID=409998 RepID=A0A2M9ZAB1_9LEPT|nr:histidine triad nucleotide-binding protein [Leptospira wolffii]PJZ65369.1 histidine triad nucleotide-binding protein [Leptospira wolffii]TGK64752.1 histidine triad nucleotide-binding protein [Leptospira wolffii]TGK76849.1 histidine triad nucleotide-binding protein [Leptospira wolffii]TGK77299.1 histidine triad nucleotide-binding protein [Leptospira wolffii]TGL26694.1 histidine triad nucleotide-binding protein [Leptospira wolffii]
MNETNCLFCKIIRKEIPAKIAFEDENILAFHDVSPQAPVHVLVIPKKHIVALNEVDSSDKALLGEILYRVSDLAKSLGLDKNGFRVVNNAGKLGGQTVFHLHFHLLGERQMTWPPG